MIIIALLMSNVPLSRSSRGDGGQRRGSVRSCLL